MIFCNTTIYFMLVKRLVQLQFCLADKPQVMFYFPEIKETYIVHLELCKCQGITHLKGVLQFSKNSGFRILLF